MARKEEGEAGAASSPMPAPVGAERVRIRLGFSGWAPFSGLGTALARVYDYPFLEPRLKNLAMPRGAPGGLTIKP
jgi:hypothetical protein